MSSVHRYGDIMTWNMICLLRQYNTFLKNGTIYITVSELLNFLSYSCRVDHNLEGTTLPPISRLGLKRHRCVSIHAYIILYKCLRPPSHPPAEGAGRFAILASPMVTSQADVTLVTVPFGMVIVSFAIKMCGVLHNLTKLRSRDTWAALKTCSGWCRTSRLLYSWTYRKLKCARKYPHFCTHFNTSRNSFVKQ